MRVIGMALLDPTGAIASNDAATAVSLTPSECTHLWARGEEGGPERIDDSLDIVLLCDRKEQAQEAQTTPTCRPSSILRNHLTHLWSAFRMEASLAALVCHHLSRGRIPAARGVLSRAPC